MKERRGDNYVYTIVFLTSKAILSQNSSKNQQKKFYFISACPEVVNEIFLPTGLTWN